MIAMIVCKCPNGPTKAYKFLEPIVENWMDVPMYYGRTNAAKFLKKFLNYPVGEKSPHDLLTFLGNSSKFIVVVGWDKNIFTWSDVVHNKSQDIIEAENIVRKFA